MEVGGRIPTIKDNNYVEVRRSAMMLGHVAAEVVKSLSPLLPQHTWVSTICDRLRENQPYRIFCENLVCYIFDKYYHRTNLPPSL